MELYTRHEKVAGMFMIGIIILLMATVVLVGRGKDWFVRYVSYYTMMPQSYNLKEDAAVKLYNTDIGKVGSIKLQGNVVRIGILVKHAYASRIRQDSVATVKSPTLFGAEHVSIKAGTPAAAAIPAGGEIPAQPRQSISDIMEAFEVEKTAQKLLKAVQEIADMVHLLQDPKGPLFTAVDHLNATLSRVDQMTADIAAGRGNIGMVLNSDDLVVDIQKKLAKLDKIIDSLVQASGRAPVIVSKVEPILSDIGQITRAAPPAVKQLQENLALLKEIEGKASVRIDEVKGLLEGVNQAMTSLNVILAEVAKASPEIPVLLKNSQITIADVRVAINNLDKILQALQKNILIRSKLPPEPKGRNVDAGLR